MGTLWRSQPMQLVQLFIQRDSARDTLEELGEIGKLQFKDLNVNVNSFQRNFVNEVKRCEEMERRLRFLEEQVRREKDRLENEPNAVGRTKHLDEYRAGKVPEKLSFDELFTHLIDLERELQEVISNQDVFNKNYSEYVEMQHVLIKDTAFFSEGTALDKQDAPLLVPLLDDVGFVVKLGFVTGVINADQMLAFERVLWRALRGNMIMKSSEIEQPIVDVNTGDLVRKVVYIVFYQGDQAQSRIKKICESFGARTYVCPETAQQRNELLEQLKLRLSDLVRVRDRSTEHKRQLLAVLDQVLPQWIHMVKKEKAIYYTLNMFNYDHGRKCLIAEGWCPTNATDAILDALNRATAKSGSSVPSILGVVQTKEEPPTFFPTNKFTYAMHCIIEAYGVARYGEINPTAFSLVTFPFLFAVMFGDTGHAVMLLMVTLAMIFFEKKMGAMTLNEILEMLFTGRYVLLLMSLFSIFTGLIYNDIYGIGVSLLPTAWYYNATALEWQKQPDRVYEFGIDSTWKGADNELYFYNSFKMKLSIIFGVIQMTLGIFLNLFNQIHFKKWLSVWFEFIPQLLFMTLIFGYLVILIFIKWAVPLPQEPYLINVIIDIFLKFPNYPEQDIMYNGQEPIQIVICVISVICIFTMLLPKPLILRWQHKRAMKHAVQHHVDDILESQDYGSTEQRTTVDNIDPAPIPSSSSEQPAVEGHGEHGEEFDFSEVFIHQSIHTIEFVLGCISNTASYLRLWALSLAHAELSLVFYEQVLLYGMKNTTGMGFLMVFGCWAIWGGATIGVLLIMEALSAFLHALRLHWVEFQNKFYMGDGYAFEPLDFSKLKGTLIEIQN